MRIAGLTTAEIEKMLEQEAPLLEADMAELRSDPRASVIKLLLKWQRLQAKKSEESQRILKLYQYEREFHKKGFINIAGIDEAGRGPLAGPLTIGCVILPKNCRLEGINDSKKLSAKQREILFQSIHEQAIACKCLVITPEEIDSLNIYQATKQGMYRVMGDISPLPEAVLVDAMPLPDAKIPVKSIIHGDALSASIAAASIIAKVERDHIMDELDALYPVYGFKQNKGYPTAEHLAALQKYGPCAVHRKSYGPVKAWQYSMEELF